MYYHGNVYFCLGHSDACSAHTSLHIWVLGIILRISLPNHHYSWYSNFSLPNRALQPTVETVLHAILGVIHTWNAQLCIWFSNSLHTTPHTQDSTTGVVRHLGRCWGSTARRWSPSPVAPLAVDHVKTSAGHSCHYKFVAFLAGSTLGSWSKFGSPDGSQLCRGAPTSHANGSSSFVRLWALRQSQAKEV
jgi:hypothetical protein